ncbi:MAG: hypothetical protein ACJ79K_03300 [Gemmatimonadaceae bacterium]
MTAAPRACTAAKALSLFAGGREEVAQAVAKAARAVTRIAFNGALGMDVRVWD